MMKMTFNFNNPTNLIFGSGKLNDLGGEIDARRKAGILGKKALLLISNGKSFEEHCNGRGLFCKREWLRLHRGTGRRGSAGCFDCSFRYGNESR